MTALCFIEDDYVIAAEITDHLTTLGMRVLGPAKSVTTALALLNQDVPDVAILDVRLGTERVYPVARRLWEMQVPFVFAAATVEASGTAVDGEAMSLGTYHTVPLNRRRYCEGCKATPDLLTGTQNGLLRRLSMASLV